MFKRICFKGKSVSEVIELVKENYPYNFSVSMVPEAILNESVEFWLALLSIHSDYIREVPKKILNQEAFCSQIDRVKFYNYIPKQLLTKEDFINSRKNYIKVKHEHFCYEIKSKNIDTWIKIGVNWYSPEELNNNPESWYYCSLRENLKYFPEEYFSQEAADYLLNSTHWLSVYSMIPKKFIKGEWKEMLKILERRNEFFSNRKTAFDMSAAELKDLDKYYSKYQSKKELLMALELEVKLDNYVNKYCIRHFSDDLNKYRWLKELWNCMPIKDGDIAMMLQSIHPAIVLYIPERFLKRDALLCRLIFEVEEFKKYSKDRANATCIVEKLEAEEMLYYYYKYINNILKEKYPEITAKQTKEWITKE